MVFLCFTIKDRDNLVNNFNQYISNFGIETWYDRKNIFLGDNRIGTNINNGVSNPQVKYAIIFYSKNFPCGNICIDEYKILEERYKQGDVHLFPVFLQEIPSTIPRDFKLCTELVYKVIETSADFYGLCLHIIAKITSDEVEHCKCKTIREIITQSKDKNSIFIKLLIEYDNICKTNFQLRLGLLFSLFELISQENTLIDHHRKTVNYIFYQNCISPLKEEKRELQIYENILIYELLRLINL